METVYENTKSAKKHNTLWLRILFTILGFYIFGVVLLVTTQNPILFPTVVMLGSFMVPISYVAFFYERRRIAKIKLSSVILSFIYGGILGVFISSFLEPFFIRRLDFTTALIIGLIEEFSKIVGVIFVMRKRKHTSGVAGIIVGAAVGMGFASFESMGYSFTAFLRSGGSLTDTVFVTLLRAVLSPLGHGTWTAILAGVLFSESTENKFRINLKVIKYYISVSVLHGLWDGLPTVFSNVVLPGVDFFIGEGFVAIAGLVLLFKLWKNAKYLQSSVST